MWKPNIQQMATPIKIQKRVVTNVNGAPDVSYEDVESNPSVFCNWKGRGGSESTESGKLIVYDTAELTMWYRPDIDEQSIILLNGDSNLMFEVINIENVEMRNMYLILKVKRVVGN